MGCTTGDGVSNGRGNPLVLEPAELPGFNPRNLPAGEYVFGDEREWREFWQKRHNDPVPKIDFERFTIVIISLGHKPNPGYSVEITGAMEYKGEVVVNVAERLPSLGKMYAQVIVYPYDAVLVPVTGKRISFVSSRA